MGFDSFCLKFPHAVSKSFMSVSPLLLVRAMSPAHNLHPHPRGSKGHARGPDRKWNSRSGKKYLFFGEDGIFFGKLAFSVVIYGI
jgi:hypothetical protein